MVVLTDSQPNSPVKSAHTWSQSQPGSSQSQPGPSRAGMASPRSPPIPAVGVVRSPGLEGAQPPPPYVPGAGAPLLPGPSRKPRSTVPRRFFSAFIFAMIIIAAFKITASIIGEILEHAGPYEWDNSPREEDGKVLTCDTHWSNIDISDDLMSSNGSAAQLIPSYPVYSVTESFELPIGAPLHYLLARGSLLGGAAVIRGVEGADPNVVKVNVTVRYSTQHALSRTKVCKLQKPEGGVGVGVYTPHSRIDWSDNSKYQVYVLVTVALPISRDSPLVLNAFQTNMPNFRHKFERLGDRVHFEHLSVEGSNSVIESDSVYVTQGTLKTSNGHINGRYNATDSLTIETSNGAVDIDAGLTNDDTHRPSSLNIKSSNGRVEPRISLLTTHDQRPQPKGGHFSVNIRSSNGKLDVKFPTTPVDSLLNFDGRTSNANAEASVHSSFEGAFRISTTNGRAMGRLINLVDPTHRGRERNVHIEKATGTDTRGEIYWVTNGRTERSELGRVELRTTNGQAEIRFL